MKPYKCLICDYSCTTKGNMKNHIDAVHEGKKPYKCTICDYICSQQNKLTHHMNALHEGKKPHTLYNAILRIAKNFLETRENIKILTHPFYHINLG